MALTSLAELSITDASNTAFSGFSQAENVTLPSFVNGIMRANDGSIARYLSDLSGKDQTNGGSANVLTLTLAQPITAYIDGFRFSMQNTLVNTTTTPTIALNGLAAKTIQKYNSAGSLVALAVGDNAAGLRQYEYLTSPDKVILLNPAIPELTSNDAGAGSGPDFKQLRNSASPAVSDSLGRRLIAGMSSTGVERNYAFDRTLIADATNTSEDAVYEQGVIISGTETYLLGLGELAAGTADPNAVALLKGQLSFPATQNASSNANTLDDYEEGTWTPSDASGAGLTFTSVTAKYVKIGKVVNVWFRLTYPATANGTGMSIGGLPFTADNSVNFGAGAIFTTAASPNGGLTGIVTSNATTFTSVNNAAGATPSNVTLSTALVSGCLTYLAAS